MLRVLVAVGVLMVMVGPVLAQEPVGCDKFRFDIARERALLSGDDTGSAANGDTVSLPSAQALALTLAAFDKANLPLPPERQPKSVASFAGYLRVRAPPRSDKYKISVSAAAWIDVEQEGRRLKSSAFSGVLGCAGIRKSVIFFLEARPFIVEFSGVDAPFIKLTVTPDKQD
jgi:hypothetical protein